MSEGLNKVMLLGNLGADPELRMTPGGQPILKLRLATSETYVDRNDVRQERTEWHSVTLWGKRGEALAKILTKGERVFVEGRLQTSSYEKDGEKRYRTEIVATNIVLNGRGSSDREDSPRSRDTGVARNVETRRIAGQAAPPPEDFGDYGNAGGADDIPF
jgi:single-strand DNA-binding protein